MIRGFREWMKSNEDRLLDSAVATSIDLGSSWLKDNFPRVFREIPGTWRWPCTRCSSATAGSTNRPSPRAWSP